MANMIDIYFKNNYGKIQWIDNVFMCQRAKKHQLDNQTHSDYVRQLPFYLELWDNTPNDKESFAYRSAAGVRLKPQNDTKEQSMDSFNYFTG